MRFVATKTEEQLDLQALHRVRARLVAERTATVNQIRAFLGKISKRGNKYLRMLFVQAARVVLLKQVNWERYGLKSWIEAAAIRPALLQPAGGFF
jgi:transposase